MMSQVLNNKIISGCVVYNLAPVTPSVIPEVCLFTVSDTLIQILASC